jgi:hypothetical protein
VLVVKDSLTYTEPSDYFCYDDISVPVYAASPVEEEYTESSEKLFSMTEGNVVRVDAYYKSYGRIITEYGDIVGWVDLSKLSPWYSYNYYETASGDINGDGYLDEMDAAALGEVIKAEKSLPYGVSAVTADERRAADMNYDGVLDESDLTALLTKLYIPQETEPTTEYYTEPDTEPYIEYDDDGNAII